MGNRYRNERIEIKLTKEEKIRAVQIKINGTLYKEMRYGGSYICN